MFSLVLYVKQLLDPRPVLDSYSVGQSSLQAEGELDINLARLNKFW